MHELDETDAAFGEPAREEAVARIGAGALHIRAIRFQETRGLTGDVGGFGHAGLHPVDHLVLTGGGVKPGFDLGRTDDYAFNIVEDPVHVHDFQATVMHLLGIDHERLTYRYEGRNFRLTDVHGHVVKSVLS